MTTRDRLVATAAATATAVVAVCLWHFAPRVLGIVGVWTIVVVIGLLANAQFAVERRRRRCCARRVHGVTVHVEPGVGAYTAGPLVPRVFIGSALIALLDEEEVRAVVLHEEAHRSRFDPLRAALDHVAGVGRRRSGRRAVSVARREIRADRMAVTWGASRAAIAAALLKVPTSGSRGVGFAPATELRVRALLGDDIPITTHGRLRPVVVTGALVGAVACVQSAHALGAVVVRCCS